MKTLKELGNELVNYICTKDERNRDVLKRLGIDNIYQLIPAYQSNQFILYVDIENTIKVFLKGVTIAVEDQKFSDEVSRSKALALLNEVFHVESYQEILGLLEYLQGDYSVNKEVFLMAVILGNAEIQYNLKEILKLINNKAKPRERIIKGYFDSNIKEIKNNES